MVEGIIGKKVGMTEIFLEDGTVEACTVVSAGPCLVVHKTPYSLQLGFEEVKPQRVSKPMMGHFRKAGVPPLRIIREFKGEIEKYNRGDLIKADIFKEGDTIDVTGISKGKGFAGVMKRHKFSGQPDSHGGMAHRRPGSIGQASFPARVFKGMRMPGHMGSKRVTMQRLTVARVDPEKDLLIVKGTVPGPNGGLLILRHTTKGRM